MDLGSSPRSGHSLPIPAFITSIFFTLIVGCKMIQISLRKLFTAACHMQFSLLQWTLSTLLVQQRVLQRFLPSDEEKTKAESLVSSCISPERRSAVPHEVMRFRKLHSDRGLLLILLLIFLLILILVYLLTLLLVYLLILLLILLL